jgi:hypothetical protein
VKPSLAKIRRAAFWSLTVASGVAVLVLGSTWAALYLETLQ